MSSFAVLERTLSLSDQRFSLCLIYYYFCMFQCNCLHSRVYCTFCYGTAEYLPCFVLHCSVKIYQNSFFLAQNFKIVKAKTRWFASNAADIYFFVPVKCVVLPFCFKFHSDVTATSCCVCTPRASRLGVVSYSEPRIVFKINLIKSRMNVICRKIWGPPDIAV